MSKKSFLCDKKTFNLILTLHIGSMLIVVALEKGKLLIHLLVTLLREKGVLII